MENFWREIYGKKVQHNGEAGWIKNQYQQNPSMEWSPICVKDVAETLRTTLNWKAPGRNQIPHFWLKQLTVTHRNIAAIFNKLTEEDQIPEWLTAGFQGDTLSPLLFCISLIPLTEQLNRLNTGYEEHTTKTKISHLLYMDD